MFAGRLLGFPHDWTKGGRRTIPLTYPRRIYNPNWYVARRQLPDGTIAETFQPWPKFTFVGPAHAKYPRPEAFDYVRELPHMQPPPNGTRTTFIKQRVIVDGGVPGGELIPQFQPGIVTLPNLYQVPFGYVLEIKKFLVIPLDTSYHTLYVTILKDGAEAFYVQGANRLAPNPGSLNPVGAGYEILPNWPQDQFNTEMRFRNSEWVGVQVVNNTFAQREVEIAVWGWKHPDTYVLDDLGLK